MQEFDIGYPHSGAVRKIGRDFRSFQNQLTAWRLNEDYYDGERENGYGGFRYDGRWAQIVPRIIDRYGLTENSSVLDLGCKKGFFLHDLKQALPGIKIRGVESHPYPLKHAMESVKPFLSQAPYDALPFENDEFDFVMAFASVYMLNLGGVVGSLKEIQRVGRGKSYVTLGAYRKPEDRDLFLQWTLLGTTVLHVDEWMQVFEESGFTGDYYFSTAEALHLQWADT